MSDGTPHDPHSGHEQHSGHDQHAGHEHSGHDRHSGHDKHAGHSPEMFRDRFWLALALTVPVVFWSAHIQELLGYRAPTFPGVEWIPPVLGTVVFLYGGLHARPHDAERAARGVARGGDKRTVPDRSGAPAAPRHRLYAHSSCSSAS